MTPARLRARRADNKRPADDRGGRPPTGALQKCSADREFRNRGARPVEFARVFGSVLQLFDQVANALVQLRIGLPKLIDVLELVRVRFAVFLDFDLDRSTTVELDGEPRRLPA